MPKKAVTAPAGLDGVGLGADSNHHHPALNYLPTKTLMFKYA